MFGTNQQYMDRKKTRRSHFSPPLDDFFLDRKYILTRVGDRPPLVPVVIISLEQICTSCLRNLRTLILCNMKM